jgi:DnaJ-class molecular chaperone
MIDELLGRLEATTVKFDIGRGGVPTLTPQDIAAALGMCQDKRAAKVYQCFAGETADPKELDFIVATIQFEEWRNRADRMLEAQLAVASADMALGGRQDAKRRAKLLMDGAKAAMWPPLVEETYAAMRRTLIAELRSPKICHICNGRKAVKHGELLVECMTCLGTGKTAISNNRRALHMGICKSSYIRTWGKVYEWTYRHINDAICDGRDAFRKALGWAA